MRNVAAVTWFVSLSSLMKFCPPMSSLLRLTKNHLPRWLNRDHFCRIQVHFRRIQIDFCRIQIDFRRITVSLSLALAFPTLLPNTVSQLENRQFTGIYISAVWILKNAAWSHTLIVEGEVEFTLGFTFTILFQEGESNILAGLLAYLWGRGRIFPYHWPIISNDRVFRCVTMTFCSFEGGIEFLGVQNAAWSTLLNSRPNWCSPFFWEGESISRGIVLFRGKGRIFAREIGVSLAS